MEDRRESEIKLPSLAEALFEGEIEGICRKAIEEAKQGNIQAIKLVLDRILPPKKEAPIFIDLPAHENRLRYFRSDSSEWLTAVCRGEHNPYRRRCASPESSKGRRKP